MESSDQTRTLKWAHGSLTVQRLGAMLAPVQFHLPGGHCVEPMHIAPWADDGTVSEKDLAREPAILGKLRGEWPCVPFGADEPLALSPAWQPSIGRASSLPKNAPPHGESSNAKWHWCVGRADQLALALDYPKDHPIARVERHIIPDPHAPAADIVLRIIARKNCQLPIGLHPTFCLSGVVGSARIVAPQTASIRSYPGSIEPGAEIFAADAVFDNLAQAPAFAGGTLDASRVPFAAPGEDLVQLVGVARGQVSLDQVSLDQVSLDKSHEAYRTTLTWNAEHFPSLVIWYSNKGRQHTPWLGRHIAVGLEPVCSAFDLGDAIAAGNNPIHQQGVPTNMAFIAGQVFQTNYRIEASSIG